MYNILTMKEIKLTNSGFTLVDDENFDYLNQWKWQKSDNGYAYRCDKGKGVYIHRLINKTLFGLSTDHINRNKLDNRKENLRTCIGQLNFFNRGLNKNNTSGYKGICWEKKRKKWFAQIMINRKHHFLGYFNNIKEAVLVRNQVERLYI